MHQLTEGDFVVVDEPNQRERTLHYVQRASLGLSSLRAIAPSARRATKEEARALHQSGGSVFFVPRGGIVRKTHEEDFRGVAVATLSSERGKKEPTVRRDPHRVKVMKEKTPHHRGGAMQPAYSS